MSKLAAEILFKGPTPPIVQFAAKPKTLYELLNVQRFNGRRIKVVPEHWYERGYQNCYYIVHKTKYRLYKDEPTHGKSWGMLYWHGKKQAQSVEIKGGLKFSWMVYKSPKKDGIFYNPDTSLDVERRRTRKVKEFFNVQPGKKD